MISKSANIAVVGCGYWGKNLVRNFAQLGALRCVCDTNKAALQAQEQLYPGIQLRTDFQEVLADDDIRAVVIAAPAAQHYLLVKQALNWGKDVLVEKPLTLQYAEGKELVELAEAKNAVLAVGHVLEYHPAVTLLRDLVQQGDLGKIYYIYSNRLNLGKVRHEENILWSFAPHDIAVICRLVGAEPISVSSSGGTYLQPGIADVTITNLVFDDNIRSHIFVSWLHPYKEQKLVVIGDKKMAVFDDTLREGKLKVFDRGIEWQSGLPIPRHTSEMTLFLEETEPLQLECKHFLSCIHERKKPITDGKSALTVLKVLQASHLSLDRGGVPVALSDIG